MTSAAAGAAPGTGRDDHHFLRQAFALAVEARLEGNNPFACLLVGGTGEVLMKQKNQGLVPVPGRAIHAETDLAREASTRFSPALLGSCTLYTSAEPCAMCAGAIYWAGIGRVVFGITERELGTITGNHPDNPTLDLPCREVFAHGQHPVEVIGPLLLDEARAVHADFWS